MQATEREKEHRDTDGVAFDQYGNLLVQDNNHCFLDYKQCQCTFSIPATNSFLFQNIRLLSPTFETQIITLAPFEHQLT
jgi:hypothetical protein